MAPHVRLTDLSAFENDFDLLPDTEELKDDSSNGPDDNSNTGVSVFRDMLQGTREFTRDRMLHGVEVEDDGGDNDLEDRCFVLQQGLEADLSIPQVPEGFTVPPPNASSGGVPF